jgi:transcriptional regulator with XRE-family HTH domain
MGTHERLDAALSGRRLQLGISWSTLATQVGVSESALRNIRRGRNLPSDLTKHRLEEALGWAAGSIDAVLEGSEPTTARDAQAREQHPRLYDQGYQVGQNLDAATLASILRSVSSDLLVAELGRRLADLETSRYRNDM